MAGDARDGAVTRVRDGRAWRIGVREEVDWITEGVSSGLAITSAIPPIFAAYATIVFPTPEDGLDPPERETDWAAHHAEWSRVARPRHERTLLDVLAAEAGDQPWWLGYLDTGSADTVFPDALMAWVYHSSWRYLLVSAGPDQAAGWRDGQWKLDLPDIAFPADRSWLLSTLWDDDWSSLGGSQRLVARLVADPLLGARTRPVSVDEDATPPGHTAF